MKIILLGGNSLKNKEWVEGMAVLLKKQYDDVVAFHYLHWKEGGALINLDREIDGLKILLKDCSEYIFIAKSAGSLIALKGIYKNIFSPRVCVFLGLPVLWSRKNGFEIDFWLNGFSVPTLFIQKLEDPAIYAKNLKILLEKVGVSNYSVNTVPGNEHEYSEFSDNVAKIISFIS